MIKRILAEDLLVADEPWHTCCFHFSFGDYVYADRHQFGVLKLLNDDTIQPGKGYEMHPHEELEIISYCVQGELVHRDGMGNHTTLRRGDVQYVCAGSGITHSLISGDQGESLRLLQMWIKPDKEKLAPHYIHKTCRKRDRHNRLLHVMSDNGRQGTIAIHQDANLYVSEMDEGNGVVLDGLSDRLCYLVCIEGNIRANSENLNANDALEISRENSLNITALNDAHILLVEMGDKR